MQPGDDPATAPLPPGRGAVGRVSGSPRTAFVDEFQSNSARDPDTYILTAAVCDNGALADAWWVIAALRVKGERELHWRDENDKRRRQITEAIADVPLQRYFSQPVSENGRSRISGGTS